MKRLSKIVMGAILATAISIGIKSDVSPKISKQQAEQKIQAAFQRACPQNISTIAYDPEFTELETYIRKKIEHDADKETIDKIVQESKKARPGHTMGVQGFFKYIGDGQKRPVFARKELFEKSYVTTTEDIASIIDHEDAHADEERNGLDFYKYYMNGQETTHLIRTKRFRTEIMLKIGELGACARQLEKIYSGERNPSNACKTDALEWLKYSIVNLETERMYSRLLPKEQEFYEAKKKRYPKVFDTVDIITLLR